MEWLNPARDRWEVASGTGSHVNDNHGLGYVERFDVYDSETDYKICKLWISYEK